MGQSSSKTFTNWSGNLNTKQRIHHPKNDDNIIYIIKKAKKHNRKLRVVGAGHSISPIVCNTKEKDIILLCLDQYQLDPENIIIDHKNLTVTVNAGWKLAQLAHELHKHSYYLETQPASSAFNIAGLICTPVHGAKLGASLLADSVVSLRLITKNGEIITKYKCDPEFNYYQLSLGMFGIITSVSFKIYKLDNFYLNIKTYDFDLTNPDPALNDFFIKTVSKCLNPFQTLNNSSDISNSSDSSHSFSTSDSFDHSDIFNLSDSQSISDLFPPPINPIPLTCNDQPKNQASPPIQEFQPITDDEYIDNRAEYVQCFLDLHNAKMVKISWKQSLKKAKIVTNYPAMFEVQKYNMLERFLRRINTNYRKSPMTLNVIGRFAQHNIIQNIQKNYHETRDMFWLSSAVRAYFMEYYIPISSTDSKEINIDNIYKAIEVVTTTLAKFKASDKRFILDLPCEFRFVVSSSCKLSPIYSPDTKIVYLGIEIPCIADNLFLTSKFKRQTRLNEQFRRFYTEVEQGWIALGGKPHWGKLFGFYPDQHKLFSRSEIFSPDDKAFLRSRVPKLFINNFIQKLLVNTNR